MALLIKDYEIKKESTFKIGGIVREAVFPENVDELAGLLKQKKYDIVLGSCSNVLFGSGRIEKNIILTKKINEYAFDGNLLKVSCGAKGPVISNECMKRGLAGFEFLIGFPGSFGGMIAVNASAHGQSISDTFVKARLFDIRQQKILTLSKSDMNFSYRNSAANNECCIVLDAEFELKHGDFYKIKDIMEQNKSFRMQSQPGLRYGNAGSIFKNPPYYPAGKLLDSCGLKGSRVGGAMVFEKHANIIINYDNATSADVIQLMHNMYSKVKEKYTIELEPEIIYIGSDKTEDKLWKEMKK